ncbi:hypothetical protein EV426DRAFT_710698 [Tirmania nivea]|nr:hypothetical protein EV426DRAFT_710698 [Tirmania nivea]
MPPTARHGRMDKRLAQELELKLHINSLPIPPSVRLNEYSIPSDGIRWDILIKNITKLLGEETYLWNTVSSSTSVILSNSQDSEQYSRPDDGWYTMYAANPLTVSQVNDLRAWTAQANEEGQMAAKSAWRTGGKNDHNRPEKQELIRLERKQRRARDQERWRREKRRREFERKIAWGKRGTGMKGGDTLGKGLGQMRKYGKWTR